MLAPGCQRLTEPRASIIVTFMKKVYAFLIILSISFVMLACNLAQYLPVAWNADVITPTPVSDIPVTNTPAFVSTPLPTETPLPTSEPVPQIEEAEKAYFYGDWEKALDIYMQTYNASVEQELRSAALLGMGKTYYAQGEFSSALQPLRTLVELFPQSEHVAGGYLYLARTYDALSRYAEAADAYAAYLSHRPGIIDSYVQEWRGDALTSAGNYADAIQAYQLALSQPRVDSLEPVQVKIGQSYAALGEYGTAVILYTDIYSRTVNDYIKAQVDYLMGSTYLLMGEQEAGYQAFLDAVENYPLSYHSYLALVELVNAGYPVSELDRGLVDYFAGQYSVAIAAFDRYLLQGGEEGGTALYYRGLSFLRLGEAAGAMDSWDRLIAGYPDHPRYADAWDEKAYTQWAFLEEYTLAAQTLLTFVNQNPYHPRAAEFLFRAARILEIYGNLEEAIAIWERLPSEYPGSDYDDEALFHIGITHYRLGRNTEALNAFQRYQETTSGFANRSRAYFWVGKVQQAMGDTNAANVSWGVAASLDPSGYYSERAREELIGKSPFAVPQDYDLGFDLEAEKTEAEAWMRTKFAIPMTANMRDLGELKQDGRLIRGTELWNLGFYELARSEFESLRQDVQGDPLNTYRLLNYLLDLGLYRPAIFAARHILDLAGLDDFGTLSAPVYFNHVRFGLYYADLILPLAKKYDFNPLFVYSVVRQESLFEGFVRSSAGARGLMQIVPSTAINIVEREGYPPDYSPDDLYRPIVNLRLGIDYLDSQRDFFDGDLFAALAAYNAGPGNAIVWHQLAGGDSDLFVELVRFDETQRYLKGIYEVYVIYRRLYERVP